MLIRGDARAIPLRDESVQCVVCSPPYWGLRDYGVAGQIGLEADPQAYVAQLVSVFREVRRVLRSDGTLWLNIGDSYAGAAGGAQGKNGACVGRAAAELGEREAPRSKVAGGLKAKDLAGIPWRVALALQDDGWWLRSDIIWAKPNPMPESVEDRPTRAHEYLFLLTRSANYTYNGDAIREPYKPESAGRYAYSKQGTAPTCRQVDGDVERRERERGLREMNPRGRNARSVWELPTQPYHGAHFATFPPEIPRRCILAGTRPGDRVLDPFVGSGTTARVARELGREGLGMDLSREYLSLARQRIRTTGGLQLAAVAP